MKKLLFALIAVVTFNAITPDAVQAQSPEVFNASRDAKIKKDTIVDTDTARLYFNNIESSVKSFEILVQKISGTVAGKVYLQGSNTGWLYADNIDSLTCANQSQNFKHVNITATNYLSYRIYYPTTSTQICVVYFAVLRRPDDER